MEVEVKKEVEVALVCNLSLFAPPGHVGGIRKREVSTDTKKTKKRTVV